MLIRKLTLGALTLASIALPGLASAQSYGYRDQGGSYQSGHRYNDDRSYRYQDRREDRYARARFEEQRRREEARRRHWRHEHREYRGGGDYRYDRY